MKTLVFCWLTILTIGCSFGGNEGSTDRGDPSPLTTRLKPNVSRVEIDLQRGASGFSSPTGATMRGILPENPLPSGVSRSSGGSRASAFKPLHSFAGSQTGTSMGEDAVAANPSYHSTGARSTDASALPSASFLWPSDLPFNLPLMVRRSAAPSHTGPLVVKEEKGQSSGGNQAMRRRRTPATWRDYEAIPQISPVAAFIGDRDVLKEFSTKEMLRRCHGRFIVKPAFSLKDWMDPYPQLKSTLHRVLDRLRTEGKVKKKTFVSMRKDLNFFRNHLLHTYSEYEDEHDDFMRLVLRLLEKKRGEAIVVEMAD